jgi:hypothetical protein
MKTCRRCQKTQPETTEFFQLDKRGKNGFNSRCKKCTRDVAGEWRRANKDLVRQRAKKYAIKRKDKAKEYRLKYYQTKLKIDPFYRACGNIRRRAKEVLKTGANSSTLGCNGKQLKTHLESQFVPGMTWENYGEWHIDHIYPLSVAYAKGPESFKKACHYTNLQPLWAVDNLRKSDTIPE